MNELLQNLNKEKFSIILDHQPNDYNNQTDAEADLVLSGHTHGGQLFPLNKVGEWIGANDKTYGYEKRKQTNFIVTSGLSDWPSSSKPVQNPNLSSLISNTTTRPHPNEPGQSLNTSIKKPPIAEVFCY